MTLTRKRQTLMSCTMCNIAYPPTEETTPCRICKDELSKGLDPVYKPELDPLMAVPVFYQGQPGAPTYTPAPNSK
jgi:hypothetical protein